MSVDKAPPFKNRCRLHNMIEWFKSLQGSDAYEAIETLLKGLEVPLLDDHHFFDKYEHVACLDYSVVGDHSGKLCAYRFGVEATLRKENFERVENS